MKASRQYSAALLLQCQEFTALRRLQILLACHPEAGAMTLHRVTYRETIDQLFFDVEEEEEQNRRGGNIIQHETISQLFLQGEKSKVSHSQHRLENHL